jgi:enamine deaminase RidA (YjgF/YER057c/UK114 family)
MSRDVINSQQYHVPVAGFSQAVRAPAAGTFIFVSGLTARRADGSIDGVGDVALQTRIILANLRTILAEAGATLDDVVRVVTYLRDMGAHEVMHTVRREFFGDTPPASTTIEVSRLFDESQLLEIEATAIVDASQRVPI